MRRITAFSLFLLLVCAGLAASWAEAGVSERVVMGWLESIVLEPWGFKVRAKLDSGAKTSSLNAKNIRRFKKNGKKWVRFTLRRERPKKNEARSVEVERPLVRIVFIKRHGRRSQRRPVVTLPFCLNGQHYETAFTLVDRSVFNYPVLLGRNFLKDIALIDPGASFLNSSRCKSRGKKRARQRANGDNPKQK